jgi:inhibitor of KinA
VSVLLETPTVVPSGDTAALVSFGEVSSVTVMERMYALAGAVESARVTGVRAAILGRTSVLVYYDPIALSFDDIDALVRDLVGRGIEVRPIAGRDRELPTVYGGEYGTDLRHVAEFHGMTEEEVVRLQTSSTYTAVFVSFAPGLAQLMGLPPAIAMARKRNPEVVPAGSIVLASLIVPMPIESPSGWWCIGRTPVPLFRPYADEITYIQPGDRIRFTAIGGSEYERLSAAARDR